MAMLPPNEMTVIFERRQVAITKGDGTERLGFFHKWTENGDDDFALVENTDGTLEYIPPHAIRFLPVDDDIAPKELEKAYKNLGIIKAGASEKEPSNENRCPICLDVIPDGQRICTKCEKKGWKQIK